MKNTARTSCGGRCERPANARLFMLKLLAAFVLLTATPAPAGNTPVLPLAQAPESVLFVGNSLTFYNNAIYTHLRRLLVAENPALRQDVFLKSMTISGARLSDHRGGLEQMLNSRPWDIVVLQGHSLEAVDASMAGEFRSSAARFTTTVSEHDAEAVLFMTWARSDEPERITELARAFTVLGNDLGVAVIPVGLAFERARQQMPGLSLHDPDRIHPSLAGTYLAAAVFYAALFGKSPTTLDYTAGLDDTVARRLREIAWKTVTG